MIRTELWQHLSHIVLLNSFLHLASDIFFECCYFFCYATLSHLVSSFVVNNVSSLIVADEVFYHGVLLLSPSLL